MEGDHFNVELALVLGDELLSVVRAVEVFALRVFAWTSVVSANNEVGGAEVLADDGVPDRFTRTAHAHSKGKESERSHTVWVSADDGLIDAYTGESVHIAGLGETDDRLDEDVGLMLSGGADGELTVSSVHGVAGLEGDHLAPCHLFEERPGLGRSVCATGSAQIVIKKMNACSHRRAT